MFSFCPGPCRLLIDSFAQQWKLRKGPGTETQGRKKGHDF